MLVGAQKDSQRWWKILPIEFDDLIEHQPPTAALKGYNKIISTLEVKKKNLFLAAKR